MVHSNKTSTTKVLKPPSNATTHANLVHGRQQINAIKVV